MVSVEDMWKQRKKVKNKQVLMLQRERETDRHRERELCSLISLMSDARCVAFHQSC